MTDETVTSRVEMLEEATTAALQMIELQRNEITALRIMLCTLLDSLRPEERAKSDEWFDAMHEVATRNLALSVDMGEAAVARVVGASAARAEAAEEEKAAVTEMLDNLYAMLRSPQGSL